MNDFLNIAFPIKPKIVTGDAWINNQFVPVTFIKATDCNNNPENYIKVLQSDDPAVTVDSEICENHMRYNVGHHHDYGQGFWEGTEPGTRGATKFYYAKTKLVD